MVPLGPKKIKILKRMVKKSLKSLFEIRRSKICTLSQQNTDPRVQNGRFAHRWKIKGKCALCIHKTSSSKCVLTDSRCPDYGQFHSFKFF